MATVLRVALVQVNPTVGALSANRERVVRGLEEARDGGAQVVVFPELVLSGYPPEDLLSSTSFRRDVQDELEALVPMSKGLLALVGAPLMVDGSLVNAAALLLDGRWVDTYAKAALPNYGVFDERRYFRPGRRCPVYDWGPLRFGVNICEDIWIPEGVPKVQGDAGTHLQFNLSASPYHAAKGTQRRELLSHRARSHGAALVYCNLVGGQDELVFDGDSMVVTADGSLRARGSQFREQVLLVDLELEADLEAPRRNITKPTAPLSLADSMGIGVPQDRLHQDLISLDPNLGGRPWMEVDPSRATATGHAESTHFDEEGEVYEALVLGTRDYVTKNGFSSVVIGLSGGIDSALTAAVASDALGPPAVLGVTLPSRFNSAATRSAAAELAQNLGLAFREIPIEEIAGAFGSALDPALGEREPGVTEENIQARIRGTLLMAFSNYEGRMLLTTGNKSELAVGYCTLYGDMAGGFAVLKDVPKTWVYRLARFRNRRSAVIPRDSIELPPSAELRENQLDSDSLPPYEILDAIIEARVEREDSRDSLVAAGFDPAVVDRVFRLIDLNEYKRRQAPPGIKITPRAFGKDRRYPITNRYRGY